MPFRYRYTLFEPVFAFAARLRARRANLHSRSPVLVFAGRTLAAISFGGAVCAFLVMAVGAEVLEPLFVICALFAPIGFIFSVACLVRHGRRGLCPLVLSLLASTWVVLASEAAYEGQGPLLRLAEWLGVRL